MTWRLTNEPAPCARLAADDRHALQLARLGLGKAGAVSAMVTRLSGSATQARMIARLEETLERVKAGNVRGLTIVTLSDDDEIWIANHWIKWFDSIGALSTALISADRDCSATSVDHNG